MHLPITFAVHHAGQLASAEGGGSGIFSIGILLLIPLGMYFLLIRPQRRRAREQQALQRSVAVGDEVLLTSGIYGFVTAMEDGSDVVWVEIDDDVQVRLTRAAISGKVNPTAAPAADDTTETSADGKTVAKPATAIAKALGRPTLKGGRQNAAVSEAEGSTPPASEGSAPGDE